MTYDEHLHSHDDALGTLEPEHSHEHSPHHSEAEHEGGEETTSHLTSADHHTHESESEATEPTPHHEAHSSGADQTHTEHVPAGHHETHERPVTQSHGESVHEVAVEHARPIPTEPLGDLHAGNGLDLHPPAPTPHNGVATQPTNSEPAPLALEARGLLEGIAHSLRTLAGRDGVDGASVAIFPRGVDLLEVRMHVARDQAIDLNFRVAGPTQASLRA